MEVIACPDLEERHATALQATRHDDLARHAAYHGLTVEALTSMAAAVDGDRLVFPLWADRKIVGLRLVGMDGSQSLAEGSSAGIYRSTFGPEKPGIMVAVGAMDTAAMVSAGLSAIGLFSEDTTYRAASMEVEEAGRQQAVVWSMGGFARYLLLHTPAGLERVTVCTQPQEHGSLLAWVRDGKADRKAILGRVAAFRRMWDRDGGQVAV